MLYKVKATYKYQAEDMDELAFEVGEIIDVIEYEDPEERTRRMSDPLPLRPPLFAGPWCSLWTR